MKLWPKYLPVQKENWNPGLVPVFLFFLGGFLFFSILDVFDVDEFTNLQTPLLCLFTNNKKKLNWKKFVMRLIYLIHIIMTSYLFWFISLHIMNLFVMDSFSVGIILFLTPFYLFVSLLFFRHIV